MQTIAAIACVILAVCYLAARIVKTWRASKAGCGGGCGCAASATQTDPDRRVPLQTLTLRQR